MAPTRSLLDLARVIQENTAVIDDAIKASGQPQPSFEVGGPPMVALPLEKEESRTALLEAIDEMRALVMGPLPYTILTSANWGALPGLMDVVYKFQIAQKLGPDERISYAELGRRCGLTEDTARHVVRAAISFRFFDEPEEGMVAHNAFSLVLTTVPGTADWVGFCTDDVVPATAKWAESLKKYPGSGKTTEAAYAIANGGQGFFALLDKDPIRQKRFANGQGLLTGHPSRSPALFAASLDWSGEKCPKTVIDIGGSNGPLMEAILRKFPGIEKGVVQDLPGVIAQTTVPQGLEDRMSFEVYDFFTEQKRKAEVRIFRVILHDWPDEDAIKILRNQIPVLEPGHRIILNESIVEGPRDEMAFEDQHLRVADLMMHQLFNAKERSQAEWTALFAAADPRFKVEEFIRIPPAVLSTIVVSWTG